jgi:hypothetical protein
MIYREYDPNDPMYGSSHAVQTVVIRVKSLTAGATEPGLSTTIDSHVRGMHFQAFQLLWESHVIQILGSASASLSANDPEAREIFLIAVKANLDHQVSW